uniref:Uncharacterized protein n=1 Tax=Meloidogyne enterolobii TaxID=390850 RepID=A0A6V7WRY8_MELEN|nr:unnamed protein product [Meloidogyne enterolobii]
MEGFDETNNILSWHMLRAGTLDDYKILKQIYKNNVDKLTEKVKAFVEEEINAHYSNVDVTEFKEDIKRYDQLIANGGTEGSFIDIFSFMEKHAELKDLKLIFDLSSIHSIELDKAIVEKFYEDHKKNKEMGKGYNYAVVEGAGPIGLYTTFKLFIEGINVTILNDRSADYTREQFILLDRKWIYQLNLILGTQFDQLFNEENSMAKLLPNHVGIVIMKNFETALMNRLKVLSLYVDQKEGNQQGEKSFLKLIYETEVLSINLHYEKPLAILGTPERLTNPVAHEHYTKLVNKLMNKYDINHEQALKKIIAKKTKDIRNIFGEDFVNAKKLAELAINGKAFDKEYIDGLPLNTYFGSNFLGIPFDLLFCAGGANDQIRDNFLEEPQVLTESKNYSSIYIDKADPAIKITEGDYTYLSKSLIEIGIHLEKQGFYEFIVNSNISHHLKSRYGNLINFIIYGVMEDGYGYLMPTYNNFTHETLVLHVFELKQRLSIATNTPKALVNFIEEIKAEMNENLHWEEYYLNFIKELENKWAIALFKYLASLYRYDDDKLIVKTDENEGFDEEDDENIYFKILSSNTFWIKIKGVENPAKRYRTENDSAIVAAVGDANTSAHFFTGSGLSTGKLIIN